MDPTKTPESPQQPQPQPVNARANINITANKKQAFIRLDPPQNGGKRLSADEIRLALKNAGVVYGFKDQVIETLAWEPSYDTPVNIAESLEPVPGTKGSIKFYFPTSRELRPAEREDGSVDYRQLGLVKNVRARETLCAKILPVQGTPGRDVTGGEIPAVHIPDPVLPKGKNTEISIDGMSLLATVDGQADLAGNSVQVMNTLTVDKVDLSTGNIDFVGNVNVNGDVAPGSLVKAAGNIVIKGCLDGGSVVSGGNVVIGEGFNGQTTGTITAEGDVSCKYVQNGKLTATRLETGYLIGSTVQVHDSVRIVGKNAGILNSSVQARNTIECFNVGSETSSSENTLQVGNDPLLLQRFKELPQEISALKKEISGMDRVMHVFSQLKTAGRMTTDHMVKEAQVTVARNAKNDELAALELEIINAEEDMSTAGYGTIIVMGKLNPYATICIGSERIRIEQQQQFVRFVRRDGGIVSSAAK
jgi:hypothetical protein